MSANDENERAGRLGLVTRHVFLDTEVYRANDHDLTSAPFRALAALIDEGHVILHLTDITLSEVERHIREQAVD